MILLACATSQERQAALTGTGSFTGEDSGPVRIGGHEFLPCVVGIGPVAAALSAGALLERHPGVTGILNLGICGSFDTGIAPLGAVCAASAEIWPEYGVRYVNQDEGGGDIFEHQMFADLNLDPVNRLDFNPQEQAQTMGLTLHPDWVTGPSLTVAGVSGNQNRADWLAGRHKALTENMEGFSLALAARRHGMGFLEIRTVSNPVGARDKRLWNFRLALRALQNILSVLTGAPA
jgi:futalosine hydrolase